MGHNDIKRRTNSLPFGYLKGEEQSCVLERVLIWSDSKKEAATTDDESRHKKARAFIPSKSQD